MGRACISSVGVALILILLSCKGGPSQQDLFEKATIAQEQSDFAAAIAAYQEFVQRFPDAPDAPKCQFMIGYLHANHLDDDTSARQAYEIFIRNYPDHVLIKDAQWELDHLGMDVNEIDELNKILGSEPDTLDTTDKKISG